MLFVIDEDVDQAVGAFLSSRHRVEFAINLFGPQTRDELIRTWARAKGAVIVSADNEMARKCRQKRRAAILHLKDLGTDELTRVAELPPVIEAEAAIQGARLWLQIGSTQFVSARGGAR